MLPHLRSMLGRMQSLVDKIRARRYWLVFFGVLTVVGLVFLIQPAFAQAEEASWFVRGLSWVMLTVANLAIGFTIFFLRFFIMIASYNNYIDVDIVQLGWVMVRDVANMFFIVALLVIAFGTILGLEEYEWKKNLAKLILAAILINFSNLIAQLCIDVAHVFTITFLNAISATAGGNLITMFQLDNITALAVQGDTGNVDVELLAATVTSMLFALMAAVAMGSYVFVMAARVVALWSLIIMSPLAFVLGVLPKTKTYAEKWWSEFSRYVIVAPVMVFFLWLALATLGLGDTAKRIQENLPPGTQLTQQTQDEYQLEDSTIQVSLAQVTSWENMANFFIAFVFLMYGIKTTQETSVVGSGAIGSAVDFGKKVATIASGYAAGRWLVGKGGGLAGSAAGALGKGALEVSGISGKFEQIKNDTVRNTVEAYKNWKTAGPRREIVNEDLGKGEKVEAGTTLTDEELKAGYAIEKRGEEHFKVKGLTEDERLKEYKVEETKNDKGEVTGRRKVYDGYKREIRIDKNGKKVLEPVFESRVQKFMHTGYQKLISSRKKLEKVQSDTQINEELIDKSIEAQPDHILASKDNHRDHDRYKRGMLKAMEERSSAKTEEHSALGYKAVMETARYKTETQRDGSGFRGAFQNEKPSIAGQIAEHREKAAQTNEKVKEIITQARNSYLKGDKGKQVLAGKIEANLRVKAEEATGHKLEEATTTQVALANIAAATGKQAEIKEYTEQAQRARDTMHPDDYLKENERMLDEMANKGLINDEDRKTLLRSGQVNGELARQQAMGRTGNAALKDMQDSGFMNAEERAKVAKKLKDGKIPMELPEQQNVFMRTIAAEKAGHFEAMRLDQLKKKQEELFAGGHHGVEESREEAVLKAQIAASEAEIKKIEEKSAKEVATGTIAGDSVDAHELSEVQELQKKFKEAQQARIVSDTDTGIEKAGVDGQEEMAKGTYKASPEGKKKIEDLLNAQQAGIQGKAEGQRAEDQVGRKISDSIIAAMNQALKDVETKVDTDALKHLSDSNAFVRAHIAGAQAASIKKSRTTKDIEAKDYVEGEYVERREKGYVTPSNALVEDAKKSVDSFATLTASNIGKNVTDSLSNFVLQAKRSGGHENVETEITQALFGTTYAASSQANLDDAVFNMEDQLNAFLEKSAGAGGAEYLATEEGEKMNELYEVFVKKLGLLTDKGTGKLERSFSKEDNAAILQQYAASGGDADSVANSRSISKIMDEEKGVDEDGKERDLTFAEASKKHFMKKHGDREGEATAEQKKYQDKMKDRDTYYKEASSAFKSQALSTKHIQLGGHFKFDDKLGFHRMATRAEAEKEMLGELNKASGNKIETQIHSISELRSDGIARKVKRKLYRATVGTAKTKLDNKRVQERTRDMLLGQKNGEQALVKDGHYEMAAGKVNERFGTAEKDFKDGVDNYLLDSVLPQMAEGVKAFAINIASKSNQDMSQAENGLKVKVAIGEGEIKVEGMEGLLTAIEDRYRLNKGNYSPKEQVEMEEMINQAKQEIAGALKEGSAVDKKAKAVADAAAKAAADIAAAAAAAAGGGTPAPTPPTPPPAPDPAPDPAPAEDEDDED